MLALITSSNIKSNEAVVSNDVHNCLHDDDVDDDVDVDDVNDDVDDDRVTLVSIHSNVMFTIHSMR